MGGGADHGASSLYTRNYRQLKLTVFPKEECTWLSSTKCACMRVNNKHNNDLQEAMNLNESKGIWVGLEEEKGK